MWRLLLVATTLLAIYAASATAGQYEDALEAYDRKDYATAMQLVRPLAEGGDRKAQFTLGFIYANGAGVQQDYAAAVKWYRRSAEHGWASAQWNLAHLYFYGRGVEKDLIEAFVLLSLAAAGDLDAKSRQQVTKDRDTTAKKLTPAQLAEAEKRVGAWKPKPDR